MQTYKLHLIRHGYTAGNATGQYIGSTDIEITTNGINELKELKNRNVYPKSGLVFSSPMTRAMQTAKIIYPNNDIIVEPNFKEIDFGDFEGKTPEELKDREDYTKWVKGELSAAPNGESTIDFAKRLCVGVNNCVRAMMEKQVYSAAAVMHGGAIMALLSVAAVPRRKMKEWACGNGRGYTITITPSLYMKSGIIEVTAEIPEGEAHLIYGGQKDILK